MFFNKYSIIKFPVIFVTPQRFGLKHLSEVNTLLQRNKMFENNFRPNIEFYVRSRIEASRQDAGRDETHYSKNICQNPQ
ncbi:MAG TPA: hypothetical protein VH500_09075 [Nitrososphaeraceae archaeon]